MELYNIWETRYADKFDYFSTEDVFNLLKKLNIFDNNEMVESRSKKLYNT